MGQSDSLPLSKGIEDTHSQATVRSLDLTLRAMGNHQQALSKGGSKCVCRETTQQERNGDSCSGFSLPHVYGHQVESAYL